MQELKRKINLITWINIIFGSLLSKMLVFVLTPILIIFIEVMRYFKNYFKFLPAILLLTIYCILFLATYFKIAKLLRCGVMAKGKLISKEQTLLYNRTPFGLYPYYKYHFKFKGIDGKDYRFSSYATQNNIEQSKESFVLYSVWNPNWAINTGLLDGGPYLIDDDIVTSRVRMLNLLTATVSLMGIVQSINLFL